MRLELGVDFFIGEYSWGIRYLVRGEAGKLYIYRFILGGFRQDRQLRCITSGVGRRKSPPETTIYTYSKCRSSYCTHVKKVMYACLTA